MRPRLAAAISITIAAAVLAACSSGSSSGGTNTGPPTASGVHATESAPPGDIPDNQAFVAYTSAHYTVRVPEGWAMTKVGNAVLFTDKYNGIRIEQKATVVAPTITSVRTTDLPAIQASSTGFHAGDVKTVSRTAGTAILITYRADSAPNDVTGKVVVQDVERYEFWRNGSTVTITLSASVGSDNVDPWRKVTDSFAWTG